MAVIVIPIAIGAAQAGVWAYRAYQVYRAARLAAAAARAAQALEELEAAQSAAKPDDKAGEKTDSQVKAGAAASADCKDCNEDPRCDRPKKSLNSHLGSDSVRSAPKSGGKNFFQLVCEQMHGQYGPGSFEHGHHADILKTKQKQIRDRMDEVEKWKCTVDPETKNRANDALSADIDNLPYMPLTDYLARCQSIGAQGKLPTGTPTKQP